MARTGNSPSNCFCASLATRMFTNRWVKVCVFLRFWQLCYCWGGQNIALLLLLLLLLLLVLLLLLLLLLTVHCTDLLIKVASSMSFGFPGYHQKCIITGITSTRTSVRVSKMDAVARAQLTFQMLTLLQKYLYRQSQYSKTWDSKCLVLIAQIFRAFGMNPKIGVRVPLRPRHFLSQKFATFKRTLVRVSKTNAAVRAKLTFQMLTLLRISSLVSLTCMCYMWYIICIFVFCDSWIYIVGK